MTRPPTSSYCGLVTEIAQPTRERLLAGHEAQGGQQAQGGITGSPAQPHM
jgi:hypothetical protein